MLVSLSVRDVVLIKKVDLSFDSGFSSLTGETGAGKSILIDALGLILGKRSENRLIRKGQNLATVTAGFDVPDSHKVKQYVRKSGIAVEKEFILRRQIYSNGRSQSYLNDQVISLNFMKEIGLMLVEIHGQNSKQGLLDNSTHIRILDTWAGLKKYANEVSKAYFSFMETTRALDQTKLELEKLKREKESIESDLEEINILNIQDNEELELIEKRKFMVNSEKISSALNEVNLSLLGDEESKSIKDRIDLAKQSLSDVSSITGDRLINLGNALNRASIEISEVEAEIKNSESLLNFNINELEEIESRLFALRQLAKKHAVGKIEELKDIKSSLEDKLSKIYENSDQISNLSKNRHISEKNFKIKVKNLSVKRNKAAIILGKAINNEFPALKLNDVKFRVKLENLDENSWGKQGAERVLFEIESNKGSGYDSIAKIASGGELSRIMLALKASLLSTEKEFYNQKTLIFDEVDSGVGGAVAHAVGQRLSDLGNNLQVLAVTHQPQVAARANNQLKVDKIDINNDIQTTVSILNEDARLEELARMLSGAKITDAARKAAKSLLISQA